jgi:soluble lytic murein transglycosylase-like protein
MKSATRFSRIILGMCVALQMPLMLGAGSSQAESATPLFHLEHSRELLDDQAVFPANLEGKEYATYLQRRLRELLPLPYRPTATRVAEALIETSNRYKMDPLFLMAVIQQESKFNPEALGLHGEIGLMQLKPTTAQWILNKQYGSAPKLAVVAEMLKDPASNILIGSAYLAHLREKFSNRSKLYISAYNMGAARLRSKLREGESPREYSSKVIAGYVEFIGELAPNAKSSRQIAATKTFDL